MPEIEITNLPHGADKKTVFDLIRQHALAAFEPGMTITVHGRKALVVFSDLARAQTAFRGLNGKNIKNQTKPLSARLLPPAPDAPPGPGGAANPAVPAAVPEPAVTAPITWGADQRQPTPYHFVPVEGETVLDAPIFHDRLDPDNHFTGELHCTMTALTPLLAANEQFEYGQATTDLKDSIDKLVKTRSGNDKTGTVKDGKHILQPLLDPASDAVLISGAALKGMVRGSLQALLAAPLERVAERSTSFRPNTQIVLANFVREIVPALVVGADPKKPGTVQVLPLRKLRDVCFVRPDAVPFLPHRVAALLGNPSAPAGYDTAPGRNALRLKRSEVQGMSGSVSLSMSNILRPAPSTRPLDLEDALPVVNHNGLDLDAELNRLFHDSNTDPRVAEDLLTKSRDGYPLLFLHVPDGQEVTLDAHLLRGFYESLRHLCDADAGHLRDHPLVSRTAIPPLVARLRAWLQRGLQPGDVLFLERTSFPGQPPTWTAAGHHFRYRWRYRDTVQRTARPSDQAAHAQGVAPGLRDILCPRPPEMTSGPQGQPEKLSAARLLFGYVGSSQGRFAPTEPLTFGIGLRNDKGEKRVSDFAQMAGRIAVNMAVEQVDAKDREDRFLNGDQNFLVPLRPLGSPKPSAVEHYLTQDERLGLRQDGGTLCTYGDTADDASAGRLRGRKFYLHQPEARDRRELFELLHSRQPDWKSGNTFHLTGDQAALARFVSLPDTAFRFTIRFVNLRLWELGALFFTLAPTFDDVRRLGARLPAVAQPPLQRWLDRVVQKRWDKGKEKTPLLAHKLGHGRPLGLGSVALSVDRMRRLKKDTSNLPELGKVVGAALGAVRGEALDALVDHLAQSLGAGLPVWVERCLVPWLQMHRFAGRTRLDYPRGQGGLIFNYHTSLRADHARGRKGRKQTNPARLGLVDLDTLDNKDPSLAP